VALSKASVPDTRIFHVSFVQSDAPVLARQNLQISRDNPGRGSRLRAFESEQNERRKNKDEERKKAERKKERRGRRRGKKRDAVSDLRH